MSQSHLYEKQKQLKASAHSNKHKEMMKSQHCQEKYQQQQSLSAMNLDRHHYRMQQMKM